MEAFNKYCYQNYCVMKRLLLITAFLQSIHCIAQTQPELVLPTTHTIPARGTFSSNNKYLLTYADRIITWNAATARVLTTIETAGSFTWHASFINNDNNILAVTGDVVNIYQTISGELLYTLKGHKDVIYEAAQSQDGKKLATLSKDNTVIIWDVSSRRARYTIPAVRNRMDMRISMNDDGSILIIAGKTEGGKRSTFQFQAWNTSTGKMIKQFPLNDFPSFILFKDNDVLISTARQQLLYDIKRWNEKIIEKGGLDENAFAMLSPRHSLLAMDNRSFRRLPEYISITDAKTMEEKTTLYHDERIAAYTFVNDTILMSSTVSGNLYFWNINKGEITDIKESNVRGNEQQLILSPDHKRVALLGVTSRRFSLSIWNTTYRYPLVSYTNSANQVTDIFASANGDSLLFNNEQSLKLWNSKKIGNIPVSDLLDEYKSELKRAIAMVQANSIVNDELGEIFVDWKRKRVLTLHSLLKDSIKVIDIASGIRLPISFEKKMDTSDLKGHIITEIGKRTWTVPFSKYLGYNYMRLRNDGEKLFTAWSDGSFAIWNMQTNEQEFLDSLKDVVITGVKFHPGGSLIYIVGDNDSLYRYDMKIHAVTKTYGGLYDEDDEDWVLNTACTSLLKANGDVIDLEDGKKTGNIPGVAEDEIRLYSNNDKIVAYGTSSHHINIWDTEKRKIIFSLSGHTGSVLGLAFCRSNTRLISSSSDNSIRIWDLLSGKLVATAFLFGESDYLIVLPSGFYMGSKLAVSYLSFRWNGKLFPVQQFDVRFNRPDKVLQALGSSETSLIENYQHAWKKRLARLGIKEEDMDSTFHLPDAGIKNETELPEIVQSPMIKLLVKASDTKYALSKLLVSVNDVPLFGSRGMQITGNAVEKEIPIRLNTGVNRIEASCMNSAGTESIRDILYVNLLPLKDREPPKTYFIGIGVSRYKDSSMNLRYAVKDIRDLNAAFSSDNSILYDSLLLTDEKATLNSIALIKDKLMQTDVDDRVIMSLSGHGLLGKQNEFYFATYDMDFKNPSFRGLAYDSLEALLEGIPARKKLLLLDACHSGELDNDITLTSSPKKLQDGSKGAEESTDNNGVGLQNSFELMKELFSEFNSGNGAIVISAAGGLEFAYENAELDNGVFTYCIKNAILTGAADNDRDGTTSVMELKKYVSNSVEEITHGRQRPTSRKESLFMDWKVW